MCGSVTIANSRASVIVIIIIVEIIVIVSSAGFTFLYDNALFLQVSYLLGAERIDIERDRFLAEPFGFLT